MKTNKGLSLVEVLIAITILSLVSLSMARGFMILNRESVQLREKSFAIEKAVQMMEELRSVVSGSSNIGVLDDYDDGTVMNQILSTRKEVTDKADPVSGNANGRYTRKVSVINIPNESLARRVYVRVYRASNSQPLAEIVSVLRTLKNDYAPSQVYDVYILSLDNVPGWWISLSSMKPMMDSIIQDLQTRNPGLEWRTHWITRLAYGRDPYYTPTVNNTTKTNLVSPSGVYFYPGLMDKPSVGDFYYYVPGNFGGRVNVDGAIQQGVYDYSIADQYNNAVRYPDEVSLYAQHVTSATASGQTTPEISLRMLLELMNSSATVNKNILIVNLHGELVPLPPMRNYSDAAKDPAGNPNVRVVSHPGKLQYATTDATRIRVYSYVMNPDSWANDAELASLTVLLPNAYLNSAQVSVRKVIGNGTTDYAWQNATNGVEYTLTNPTLSSTLVTISNSPLRSPKNGGSNRGLASANRLYNLEYIPCEVGNPGSPEFPEGVKDLTMNNPNAAKNTARWVISIAAGALAAGQYTIETRIGTDLTTGSMTNQPTNLSRTYVWVGQTPPVTEQYQFIGDPRHMPYTDVKMNHGYNWFFRDVPSGDYEGYTKAEDGFGTNTVNFDVPRFWQVWRGGLLSTNGIMNSITGWSFYYAGLGGEMGYDDQNGFPNGLPIVGTPWNPATSAIANVDEISEWGGATTRNMRLISNAANTWWGLYWLGELYPDSEYSNWVANGNLSVGAGGYYRANFTAKGLPFDPRKQPGPMGASSFVNGNVSGNSAASYFSHDSNASNTGTLSSTGTTVAQDFNFPLLASMSAARPFRLDHNSADRRPPEWSDPIYSGIRTTTSFLENYYNASQSSSHNSSALVRLVLGGNAAHIEVNGLSPQVDFGTAQIGKLSVINLLRGFMVSGAPTLASRTIQLPMVSISSPAVTDQFTNPTSITVQWSLTWKRWDGQSYTSAYPATFSETATLQHNVKYSNDNGKSWYFVQDNAVAQAGVLDSAHATSSPISWNVSSMARGTYIVRVETYRQGMLQHYTYHQRQIYIMR